MISRNFKPIFAVIMFAIAIAFVAMPAAPANAQSVDKQVAVVTHDVSIDSQAGAIAANQNHGAVVMATAFGGQGLSQKDHRLVTSFSQRSIASRFVVPTTSNIERAERQDFTRSLKPFVLKLPPESPRQPKRFRFTPLTRDIAGARDAVIR